jgi:WD40 repeat protein
MRTEENNLRRRCFSPAQLVCTSTVLLVGFTFTSIDGFSSHLDASPDPKTALNLRLVATIPVKISDIHAEVSLESVSGELYLYGFDPTVRRSNWKSEQSADWKTLDLTSCPSPSDASFFNFVPMRTRPYLIVTKCSHLEILDKATLAVVQTLSPPSQFKTSGFEISPDERHIAVNSWKNKDESKTRLYDTADWKLVQEWNLGNGYFVADGQQLASNVYELKSPSSIVLDVCGVAFYDIQTGQRVSQWTLDTDDPNHVCPEQPLLFPRDGSGHMVTGDFGRSAISAWDSHNGGLLQHLKSKIKTGGPPPWLECISLSHEGNFAAVVWVRTEWSVEFGLTIWDLRTGKAVYELPLPEKRDPVLSVQFSSDGNHVAFVHHDRVEIFEYDVPGS